VNREHLQTFVWLRWRLLANQWRRAGSINAVLMMVLAVAAVVTAGPLFIGCIALGVFLIPKAEPVYLLYAWDVILVGFTFFWMIGLITELQRTEPLSLSKFLHLPVSVTGAFLINYISSLLRLSLILFVPIMLGFCLALIFTKGLSWLLTLPSLAAFLLMVTALTYQFQGWLASLMSNPRRRRTVIVATTMIFVLLCQLPNVLNFSTGFWGAQQHAAKSKSLVEELARLDRDDQAEGVDAVEHLRRQKEIQQQYELESKKDLRENLEHVERAVRLANLVVPLGWLPLGVVSLAEGNALPAILGILGMGLIGTASLWRAYRTTIGIYQGKFTTQKPRPAPKVETPHHTGKPAVLLLERHVLGFAEPVSAVALGGLRSLMRSPEAKMMLLTLVVIGVIFGSLLFKVPSNIPELARPLIAIGAVGFVLLCMLQLMANQFGFDRDGFRVFVLCAASRRDILLGKNLAFVPMTLGMAAILVTILQVMCPMRPDHFLAMLPQSVSMFLLFTCMTNLLSIYAPMYIAAGSLKPSNPKIGQILIQLLMVFFLFPLAQAPTLLPLGIEAGLVHSGWFPGWIAGAPVFLLLSLAECAVVIFVYRLSLVWQGGLLQDREQKILESVTTRAA
jgi:hypothetical protein